MKVYMRWAIINQCIYTRRKFIKSAAFYQLARMLEEKSSRRPTSTIDGDSALPRRSQTVETNLPVHLSHAGNGHCL